MSLLRKIAVTAGALMLTGSFSASALETIYMQDFEAGLKANEQIFIDASSGGTLEPSNSIETRTVNCGGSCPFSVTRPGDAPGTVRNWNIHHESTNPYAGGEKSVTNDMKYSPGMNGQVLGHVFANYNNQEDNYYQINNLDLSKFKDIQLMFDFDSWIEPDGFDAFAVAINDGAGWQLLEPNAPVLTDFNGNMVLDGMEYTDLNSSSDLAALTGQTGVNPVRGFTGFDATYGNGIDMAGTAIFDIASMGSNVSLRFAFASKDNYSSNAPEQEGINIDNIKLTGNCKTGGGPNCEPPSGTNSVPAPASLALAAFGIMAVRRRRANR